MKNLIFTILLTFVFGSAIFAQESKLVDEYGMTNCCDHRARMDNLLAELNNFSDARGYVFVYEGDIESREYDKNGKYKGMKTSPSEKGFGKEVINYYKNHVLFRNFPSERIDFIEAGFRETFTIEIWFVPNGADIPKSTPTLKEIKQKKPARKQFGFCGEI